MIFVFIRLSIFLNDVHHSSLDGYPSYIYFRTRNNCIPLFMYRTRSLVLLLLLALPMLVKTGLVANYWINYQYYSKVLCENKDKPMLHCNGKCALGKELKEAERSKNQAEQTAEHVLKFSFSDYLHSAPVVVPSSHLCALSSSWPPFLNQHLTVGFCTPVFQPPTLG